VCIWMEQEPGSAGAHTIDHYARQVLAGFAFRGERTTGDKASRARPLAALTEAGPARAGRRARDKGFPAEGEGFPLGNPRRPADRWDGAWGAFAKLALHRQRRLNVWL